MFRLFCLDEESSEDAAPLEASKASPDPETSTAARSSP